MKKINIGYYNDWIDARNNEFYLGDKLCHVINLPVNVGLEKFQYHKFFEKSTSRFCPVIGNFYKNTFLIKSPFKFTLYYENGFIKYKNTNLRDEHLDSFIGTVITNIEILDESVFFEISLTNFYQSDEENIFLEILDSFEEIDNYKVINARLNIYNYPRVVCVPILWKNKNKPITIDFEQILCLIRLTSYDNSDAEINIKEIQNPEEVVPHYLKNYTAYNKFKMSFEKFSKLIKMKRKKNMMKLK